MIFYKRKKRHSVFIGWINKFQGLGIIFSNDNPMATKPYISFEIKLLWINFWYVYELED